MPLEESEEGNSSCILLNHAVQCKYVEQCTLHVHCTYVTHQSSGSHFILPFRLALLLNK